MKPIMLIQHTRPFLKWPGGKFRVLSHIHPVLPAGKRLVEPFVGSGAIFLNSHYSRYLLNDINPDLINLYKIVQHQGNEFIHRAKKYFRTHYNTVDRYYFLREKFNRTRNKFTKSILFLYLNRHGYNGMCRYNRQKIFNIPFGYYKKPYFPEKELIHFAEKSQRAVFECLPFEKFFQKIKKDDVIYCDPPYAPLGKAVQFTRYTHQDFTLASHHNLARQAEHLATKNIPVIISNHDTEFTRQLYQKANQLKYFKVFRSIGSHAIYRSKVDELLAIY